MSSIQSYEPSKAANAPTSSAALPPEPTRPALVDPAPPTMADRVIAHLGEAIAGRDPAENAVLAIRTLLIGLADTAFRSDPAALSRIEGLLRDAAPVIAEHAGQRLSLEEVHLGCAAAAGLLQNLRIPYAQREAPDLLLARLHHAALLADEIDAAVRRRNIEAGGDLFRRAIRLAGARDAGRDGAALN